MFLDFKPSSHDTEKFSDNVTCTLQGIVQNVQYEYSQLQHSIDCVADKPQRNTYFELCQFFEISNLNHAKQRNFQRI